MWSVSNGLLNRKSRIPSDREWILDSGGFGELRKYGMYHYSSDDYLSCVLRLRPNYFFSMDWMCESNILEKTGLTVFDHQENTTKNIIEIKNKIEKYELEHSRTCAEQQVLTKSSLFHDIQFCGVIQGYSLESYLDHVDTLSHNNCLTSLMGVGSVCRRNSEKEIFNIIKSIHEKIPEIKLHGFGIKLSVLKKFPEIKNYLHSVDSCAWGWMTGCWNAHGRSKNPYVSLFDQKMKQLC